MNGRPRRTTKKSSNASNARGKSAGKSASGSHVWRPGASSGGAARPGKGRPEGAPSGPQPSVKAPTTKRRDGKGSDPKSKTEEEPTLDAEGKLRLNRYLGTSGVCSRRAADELIKSGAVSIDGVIVTQMGVKVDPLKDDVRVNGKQVRPDRPLYFMFNKPLGVVCTNAENEQRPRVIDCLPRGRERLFTVGRLDADSTGLILVTNDGFFSQAIAHPRHGIKKTYEVLIQGSIGLEALKKVRNGVWIGDCTTSPARVDVMRAARERTLVRVILGEGKNREIRRMFGRVGHPVLALKRVSIASLKLDGLAEGRHRPLTKSEVDGIMNLALGV